MTWVGEHACETRVVSLTFASLHHLYNTTPVHCSARSYTSHTLASLLHLLITAKKRNTSKPCHAKTGLKIFVVVISNEGLGGTSLVIPSLDRGWCFIPIVFIVCYHGGSQTPPSLLLTDYRIVCGCLRGFPF